MSGLRIPISFENRRPRFVIGQAAILPAPKPSSPHFNLNLNRNPNLNRPQSFAICHLPFAIAYLLPVMLALLADAGAAAAATNTFLPPKAASTNALASNDPVEKEYQQLMADDDAAQAEVDKWIKENRAFTAKGAGVP